MDWTNGVRVRTEPEAAAVTGASNHSVRDNPPEGRSRPNTTQGGRPLKLDQSNLKLKAGLARWECHETPFCIADP